MFFAILLSPGASNNSVLVFGPFATQALADGWVAAQNTPSNYMTVPIWNQYPATPGGPLTPSNAGVGQNIVAFLGVTVSGTYEVWLYGPFSTSALAQGYIAAMIAGNQSPTNYTTATVTAVPS
jgi:hypothetical protein